MALASHLSGKGPQRGCQPSVRGVMISTANKYTTLRTAKAIAKVSASEKAVSACKSGKSPKGNVIEIARAAGILAAKKTSELIPYCHNIVLDHIGLDFKYNKTSIEITSSTTAIAKTGVEMEALTAASIAALTVYDMLKPMDKSVVISDIRLLEKRGGKSDFIHQKANGLKAAVIVSSDSRSARKNKDTTGPFIQQWLSDLGFKTIPTRIIPDRLKDVRETMLQCCSKCDLIVTTGGTGLGPRDVTTEATYEVIEKEVPGIAETLRSYGQQRTPFSMLSRGIAGTRGNTLIINLPGSTRAVKECTSILTPAVLHAIDMMKGKGH